MDVEPITSRKLRRNAAAEASKALKGSQEQQKNVYEAIMAKQRPSSSPAAASKRHAAEEDDKEPSSEPKVTAKTRKRPAETQPEPSSDEPAQAPPAKRAKNVVASPAKPEQSLARPPPSQATAAASPAPKKKTAPVGSPKAPVASPSTKAASTALADPKKAIVVTSTRQQKQKPEDTPPKSPQDVGSARKSSRTPPAEASPIEKGAPKSPGVAAAKSPASKAFKSPRRATDTDGAPDLPPQAPEDAKPSSTAAAKVTGAATKKISAAAAANLPGTIVRRNGRKVKVVKVTTKVVKDAEDREPLDLTQFTRDQYLKRIREGSRLLTERETDPETKELFKQLSASLIEAFEAEKFPPATPSSSRHQQLEPNPNNAKNRQLLEQYDRYIEAFTQELQGWEKAKLTAQKLAASSVAASSTTTATPSKDRRKSTSAAAAASSSTPAATRQRLAQVELSSDDIDYLSQGNMLAETLQANAEFEKVVKRFVTTVDELDRTESQLRAGINSMDKTLGDIAGRLRQRAFSNVPGMDQPLRTFRSAFQ